MTYDHKSAGNVLEPNLWLPQLRYADTKYVIWKNIYEEKYAYIISEFSNKKKYLTYFLSLFHNILISNMLIERTKW
jgi:hypothetical protein